MTTRLTLTLDVPDVLADRAEYLLRAIAREARKATATVERRPLTPDELAGEVVRVMTAPVFRQADRA